MMPDFGPMIVFLVGAAALMGPFLLLVLIALGLAAAGFSPGVIFSIAVGGLVLGLVCCIVICRMLRA